MREVEKIVEQTQSRRNNAQVAKCFPKDILFVGAFKVLKDS